MKNVTEHLTAYAAYHRDKRNVAIHSLGIPLIVFALIILTSRPSFSIGFGASLPPASLLVIVLSTYYFTLDWALAVGFLFVVSIMLFLGVLVAAQPTPVWVGTGVGAFVFGWILQFIGHGWEGKKPAFLDDVMGLAIGPLFITAEAFFAAGQKQSLKAAIEAGAGPTYVRTGPAKA